MLPDPDESSVACPIVIPRTFRKIQRISPNSPLYSVMPSVQPKLKLVHHFCNYYAQQCDDLSSLRRDYNAGGWRDKEIKILYIFWPQDFIYLSYSEKV
ncbi:hypothetical protein AVEN_116692-1 [Araneus ventricosus]|uniref:Uncharacterized protein n=1 Tax=Araneus ventricosus TaxID=182803 RepID=A0A4Y2EL80_ARAVE|nr:hypothetical protein AVEN_116692-1 [Araneus ventricosus]